MKTSYLGWVAAAVFALLAVWTYMFRITEGGRPREGPPPAAPVPLSSRAPSASPAGPTVRGQDMTVKGPKDALGRKTWELHAESITLKEQEKRMEARRIQCVFFGSDAKPVATLFAAGAHMHTKTQDLQFEGPVRAVNPSGDTMRVHHLRYDGTKRKFFGSGGVRITRHTSVLTGDTLVADPTMKVVTVKGHVKGEIHSLAAAPAGGQP